MASPLTLNHKKNHRNHKNHENHTKITVQTKKIRNFHPLKGAGGGTF